jgi:hypothetical protein
MTVVRTLRPDLDHPGISIGWPRPLIPDQNGVPLPHAWISHLLTLVPAPGIQVPKDAIRGPKAIQTWRCQLCGEGCDDIRSFAPIASNSQVWPPPAAQELTVSGGPLCSTRCVRLAQAVCPHLTRTNTGIIVYARADTWENWRNVHAQLVVRTWTLIETRHTDNPSATWTTRTAKQYPKTHKRTVR